MPTPVLRQAKSMIRAFHGEVQARPTFWFMRQAGRYLPEYREIRSKAKDFVQLCLTPDLATEVTLQPIRRFGMDAAILFSDILMVPHGLGQKLAFKEGEGPVLEPVRSAADFANLRSGLDGLLKTLGPVMQTVRQVSEGLPLDTALIGFAGAPWTVATYMIEGRGKTDFAKIRKMAFGEPELFEQLMDLLIEATAIYLNAQIEAGAEAVQIFDTWSGVLPDDQFQRWAVEPVREIINLVQTKHPAVPIIAFPKGAGINLQDYAAQTGAECIGFDSTVPPEWAAKFLQPLSAVQGNLDPMLLVIGGKPMEAAVQRILKALGRGPFIFNLGHGIVPETSPDHVARLAEMIRAWHHRHT